MEVSFLSPLPPPPPFLPSTASSPAGSTLDSKLIVKMSYLATLLTLPYWVIVNL